MIPKSDAGVLPPFYGDDPTTQIRSPYQTSLVGFAESFATNPLRAEIFVGYLKHRINLLKIGVEGLQWCDGSFVEEKPDPGDIDVLTMYFPLGSDERSVWSENLDLFDSELAKGRYRTEAYYCPLVPSYVLIRQIAYWHSLFSHQRESMRWKGFIEVELSGDGSEEQAISDALVSKFQLGGQ